MKKKKRPIKRKNEKGVEGAKKEWKKERKV